MRTPWAAALQSNASVAGFPAGTINRRKVSGAQQPGGMAITLSGGPWEAAADQVKLEDAEVNLGISTSFDESTLEVTIIVETYYTSDVDEDLSMQVAVLETDLNVYQSSFRITDRCSGSGGFTDINYIQEHVLRDYITGQWGEEITTSTTAGTRTKAEFTYTIDSDWDEDNIEIVAFVNKSVGSLKGRGEILNAAKVNLK